MEYSAAIPDYAEPLVGWRAWTVGRNGRLRSVVKRTTWEPRQAVTARCLRPRWLRWGRRHHAPHADCECGVYAGEMDVAASYFRDPFFGGGSETVTRVLGRVALWGEVVECERGYRASHAYPLELYVAGRTARGDERTCALELAARLEVYGVPVFVVDADERALLQKLTRTVAV